ncbi:MAG: ferrous iron transporter B [Bdellovibrionales bacterium]|nr:ferrous iron transporter B [Bdellovibrionales bacterium]
MTTLSILADSHTSSHVVGMSGDMKPCVILAGQPNAGKTSLFNRLTGLRGHTANFPGTTVEVRSGNLKIGKTEINVLDLPGLYGLDGGSLDQEAARAALRGEAPGIPKPSLLVIVLDATRLPHQLPLAGELREQGIPTIVAVNMIDEALRKRVDIDFTRLSRELGARVVPISARKGTGLDVLLRTLEEEVLGFPVQIETPARLSSCATCGSCPITARCRWADEVAQDVSPLNAFARRGRSDRLDRMLTSPSVGLPIFLIIMAALFFSVFSLAAKPMEWIESGISLLTSVVHGLFPAGLFSSFLTDGVLAGFGGVVVFLPQICILFFGIRLLEDSGYLARAVVVMDSIMRKFGLPGQAFVPMLAAHACAVPAIMSTRLIENPRDRLRAILVLPLLTCSARLPVYLMVAVLLFGNDPIAGSLVFVGGYALGALAAIGASLVLQRSLVPGVPAPLALELPPYRLPSLRDAAQVALDRGWIFLRQAGTIILLISVVLWALSTFPQLPSESASFHDVQVYEAHESQAVGNEDQRALEYSAAGRIGRFIEPVFAPLGFDWRISVGVLSSFAAREVVVSALAVMAGVGNDVSEDDPGLIQSLRSMRRADGSILFDFPTALSLLVFFVLAMQCLPTQAITYRETRQIRWPLFQLGYMSALAYGASFLTYQIASYLVR